MIWIKIGESGIVIQKPLTLRFSVIADIKFKLRTRSNISNQCYWNVFIEIINSLNLKLKRRYEEFKERIEVTLVYILYHRVKKIEMESKTVNVVVIQTFSYTP